ncbi:MAG: hypothetical protein GYB68_12205, partial [Chloroflexi bacterium]|nr:hypothetical protein [Chloroflexota bacterium]
MTDLSTLRDFIRQQDAFQQMYAALRSSDANSHIPTLGLMRAARPAVISALVEAHQGPILVLTDRAKHAHDIAEQLLAWSPGLQVLTFAEPNPILYERSPWGQDVLQARMKVLATLYHAPEQLVIVSSARAVMQGTLPQRIFDAHVIRLERDGLLPERQPERLLMRWQQMGYGAVPVVTEPGTFSHRGGILDIYPMNSDLPVRIELWGDTVESIRAFDPRTQRSLETRRQAVITPAREALPGYGPQVEERLRSWFDEQQEAYRPTNDAADLIHPVHDRPLLESGLDFPVLEFYLPWMYGESTSLLDYLGPGSLVLVDDWSALADTVADLEEQALAVKQSYLENSQLPEDMPLPFITWGQLADDLAQMRAAQLGG